MPLGTDFDGFTDPPDDCEDMSEIQRVFHRIASEMSSPRMPRYSNKQIEAIMGKNSLRVLRDGWG